MNPRADRRPHGAPVVPAPERSQTDAPASSLFRTASACRRSSRWRRLEAALWAVAAVSALLLVLAFGDRTSFAARQGRELDEPWRATPWKATGREESPPRRPFVARLEAPSIALSALAVDGVDERTLRRAVGRIPSSSLPGEAGDVALAGHRDTDFRRLGELRRGDSLSLRTIDGTFRYRVESIRVVRPERVDLLAPERYPTLTLVTCYPFRYVGRAPLRFVVRARQIARPEDDLRSAASG